MIAAEPLWTDVMQAVGTAAAAVLTAVSVFLLVLDSRRRNRELRDAEAAQARLITFRFDYVEWGGTRFDIHVHNGSGAPIYDLDATFSERDNPANTGTVGRYDVIAAGETREVNWSPQTVVKDGEYQRVAVSVALRFVDAAGLVWERVDNGQPRRIVGRAEDPDDDTPLRRVARALRLRR